MRPHAPIAPFTQIAWCSSKIEVVFGGYEIEGVDYSAGLNIGH